MKIFLQIFQTFLTFSISLVLLQIALNNLQRLICHKTQMINHLTNLVEFI